MCVNQKGNPKTYINVVENMYKGTCTNFKSMCRETEVLRVKVGLN